MIDQEIGAHPWMPDEYAIVRRAIHSTADFELSQLFSFSPGAIASGCAALRSGMPVIVDVRMVLAGVTTALHQTRSPLYCALDYAPSVEASEFVASRDGGPNDHPPKPTAHPSGTTRTAAGMTAICLQHPRSIVVVGNAPTALLALLDLVQQGKIHPALVVGVPVGFVAVEDSKQALQASPLPYITVQGRKGGSPVAAAVVNALVELAIASGTD